jgi:hypothetical protein
MLIDYYFCEEFILKVHYIQFQVLKIIFITWTSEIQ